MTQIARPNSLVTTAWVGSITCVADDDDATYLESADSPTPHQGFVCHLPAVTSPQTTVGHAVRLRANLNSPGATPHDLVVVLENNDDDSIVTTRTYPVPDDGYVDEVLALTYPETGLLHYGSLRIRGFAQAHLEATGGNTAFVWSSSATATSYVLQIGTDSLVPTDVWDKNVGNVTTYTTSLAAGTYFSRVVPYTNGTSLTPTAIQSVVVA